ncbi:hypothetical protein Egran_05221 [Elaphomyces granulatus]|uniref:Uncharacterized protein n=1 Tax=Elaphomyces granulatus TaxID=519963 RepID=A0A232LSF7_9EURO|nr:hypothetical protein Egran_05221 [Elaphomyces granulatus]
MAKAKGKHGLSFEKKNHDVLKLPKHVRIQKRPIPHPPAASPYAGTSVPKVVYVSTKTPFMSAAKRVQKLLRHAERRAMASATADLQKGINKMDEKERLTQLTKGQETLRQEKVFIKATGRAIEKALDLGRWFQQKEDEYAVQVKPGSVLVVDDILEDSETKEKERLVNEKAQQEMNQATPAETMVHDMNADESVKEKHDTTVLPESSSAEKKKKRRRSKRNTKSTDDELPESRTRWINMVEIAVNLK